MKEDWGAVHCGGAGCAIYIVVTYYSPQNSDGMFPRAGFRFFSGAEPPNSTALSTSSSRGICLNSLASRIA